jgi:hypothetical protein
VIENEGNAQLLTARQVADAPRVSTESPAMGAERRPASDPAAGRGGPVPAGGLRIGTPIGQFGALAEVASGQRF